MKKFLILFLFIFVACKNQNKAGEVLIVKQWHIEPGINTKDIDSSSKLPQYVNQKDIYELLEKEINNDKIDLVISEGCQGEIKNDSTLKFNSWDIKSLKDAKNNNNYDDIITLIPLKLKAKFGDDIKVVCGDNDELIKKQQLSLSNIRGYYGFYLRLSQHKKNSNKFKTYKESLETIEKQKIDSPIEYCANKIKSNIEEYKNIMALRNDSFIKTIKEYVSKYNVALVIGGLHFDDLNAKLTNNNIKSKLYVPLGYDEKSEQIIKDIIKSIN